MENTSKGKKDGKHRNKINLSFLNPSTFDNIFLFKSVIVNDLEEGINEKLKNINIQINKISRDINDGKSLNLLDMPPPKIIRKSYIRTEPTIDNDQLEREKTMRERIQKLTFGNNENSINFINKKCLHVKSKLGDYLTENKNFKRSENKIQLYYKTLDSYNKEMNSSFKSNSPNKNSLMKDNFFKKAIFDEDKDRKNLNKDFLKKFNSSQIKQIIKNDKDYLNKLNNHNLDIKKGSNNTIITDKKQSLNFNSEISKMDSLKNVLSNENKNSRINSKVSYTNYDNNLLGKNEFLIESPSSRKKTFLSVFENNILKECSKPIFNNTFNNNNFLNKNKLKEINMGKSLINSSFINPINDNGLLFGNKRIDYKNKKIIDNEEYKNPSCNEIRMMKKNNFSNEDKKKSYNVRPKNSKIFESIFSNSDLINDKENNIENIVKENSLKNKYFEFTNNFNNTNFENIVNPYNIDVKNKKLM